MYIVVYKDCVLHKSETRNEALAWLKDYTKDLFFWCQTEHRGRTDIVFYDGDDTYYGYAIIKIRH